MNDFLFETERIVFSTWKEDDIHLATSLWGNRDVMQFLSSNGFYFEDQIKSRLKTEIANYDAHGIQYWKIYNKSNFDFIGCCGLKPCDIRKNGVELGFQLLPDFWGLGYAKEASAFSVSHCLNCLGNDQLFSRHHPDNIKSSKLLISLGFSLIDNVFYEPTGLIHPFYKYKA